MNFFDYWLKHRFIGEEKKGEQREIVFTSEGMELEDYFRAIPFKLGQRYDVHELCAGEVLTHIRNVSKSKAQSYCEMVYLEYNRPVFVVKPASRRGTSYTYFVETND